MTGPSGLVSRSRKAPRRPPAAALLNGLPRPGRNGGFRLGSLMGGLCHGFRIMAIWPPFGEFHWLTLCMRFADKRARPRTLFHGFWWSYLSMADPWVAASGGFLKG